MKEIVIKFSDDFHPRDVERLKNDDKWVADFLENHEYNVKSAFKQFIDTLEWRRDYGVNGELADSQAKLMMTFGFLNRN